MTTFSDMVFHMGGTPVGGFMTTGKAIFVKPNSGSDANTGLKPTQAVKTLSKAHTLATADKGDVVYLISESNTAASTTDYQSATLTWSKDQVHLIGLSGAPNFVQQRSRIAQLSTATGVSPLMTISADNAFFSNFSVFHGVADATSKIAVSVTGSRNAFKRCTFSGIGHADMDATDAASFEIAGGSENVIEDCYIGLDTIARGTAVNSEIRLNTGATRNLFRDCVIATYAEAAGHQFVLVPTNGLDRWTIFKNCIFMNMPTGDAAGTTMTEAFDVTGGGSPDGIIYLENCSIVGCTDWEAATVSGKVIIRTNGAGTAATEGLSADVAAS